MGATCEACGIWFDTVEAIEKHIELRHGDKYRSALEEIAGPRDGAACEVVLPDHDKNDCPRCIARRVLGYEE